MFDWFNSVLRRIGNISAIYLNLLGILACYILTFRDLNLVTQRIVYIQLRVYPYVNILKSPEGTWRFIRRRQREIVISNCANRFLWFARIRTSFPRYKQFILLPWIVNQVLCLNEAFELRSERANCTIRYNDISGKSPWPYMTFVHIYVLVSTLHHVKIGLLKTSLTRIHFSREIYNRWYLSNAYLLWIC